MDEHALRVLEFDKVLARLAALTSFSAGRDLALALQPTPFYDEALERQRVLAEARRIRAMRTPLNLNSAIDVRPALEKAELGGSLDGQELLAVAVTQRVAQQAHATLTRIANVLPRVGALGGSLVERQQVVDEIGKAVDQRGEIVDGASAALAVI